MIRRAVVTILLIPSIAMGGPPFVTDDPEPTDTGHFENYLYVEGTRAAGAYDDPGAGVEINYGVLPQTQLTLSLPLNPNPGPGGLGIVWAPLETGVKYRFLTEDEQGWRPQLAFFPQVSVPVGAAARDTPVTELLPLWAQKSLASWIAFGGGGYVNNPGSSNRSYLIYGAALQRPITPRGSLGAEVFGQTSATVGGRGSTAVGIAGTYDFNRIWHLVGSANASVAGESDLDRFSINLALKWTP